MDEKKIVKSDVVHNVIMENREKINVTGVESVETFDENKIVVLTQMGVLTISGDDMHINMLSVDSGELLIDGTIESIVYSDDYYNGSKESFFAKLFH